MSRDADRTVSLKMKNPNCRGKFEKVIKCPQHNRFSRIPNVGRRNGIPYRTCTQRFWISNNYVSDRWKFCYWICNYSAEDNIQLRRKKLLLWPNNGICVFRAFNVESKQKATYKRRRRECEKATIKQIERWHGHKNRTNICIQLLISVVSLCLCVLYWRSAPFPCYPSTDFVAALRCNCNFFCFFVDAFNYSDGWYTVVGVVVAAAVVVVHRLFLRFIFHVVHVVQITAS